MGKNFDEERLDAVLKTLDAGVHEFEFEESELVRTDPGSASDVVKENRESPTVKRKDMNPIVRRVSPRSTMVRINSSLVHVMDRYRLDHSMDGHRLSIKRVVEHFILVGLKKESPEVFKSLDESLKSIIKL